MTDLYLNGVRYRPIEGYEEYLISENGDIYSRRYDRILKQRISKQGYKLINLVNKATVRVHRLVANAFIDNPLNKPQVNHINGDKKDNRVENLEWATAKENMRHAVANGLRGISCKSNTKLSDRQVQQIRALKGILPVKNIARIYNISWNHVYYILANAQWRNVV